MCNGSEGAIQAEAQSRQGVIRISLESSFQPMPAPGPQGPVSGKPGEHRSMRPKWSVISAPMQGLPGTDRRRLHYRGRAPPGSSHGISLGLIPRTGCAPD